MSLAMSNKGAKSVLHLPEKKSCQALHMSYVLGKLNVTHKHYVIFLSQPKKKNNKARIDKLI